MKTFTIDGETVEPRRILLRKELEHPIHADDIKNLFEEFNACDFLVDLDTESNGIQTWSTFTLYQNKTQEEIKEEAIELANKKIQELNDDIEEIRKTEI